MALNRQPVEQHYSLQEVAGLLKVSLRTVRRWADEGRLVPVRRLSPGVVRVPACAVHRLLDPTQEGK